MNILDAIDELNFEIKRINFSKTILSKIQEDGNINASKILFGVNFHDKNPEITIKTKTFEDFIKCVNLIRLYDDVSIIPKKGIQVWRGENILHFRLNPKNNCSFYYFVVKYNVWKEFELESLINALEKDKEELTFY